MFRKLLLTGVMTFALASTAFAIGDRVADKAIKQLTEIAPSAITSSDYYPVYDGSADSEKKINAVRTRKLPLYPAEIDLDDSNPPAKNTTEGGTGNTFEVLQFDADGGATGDDHVWFKFHVPDGYITDSLRLNVIWSSETAGTGTDTVTWDMAVMAVASGESVDGTMTAFTAVADDQWTGVADLLFTTQLNPEVMAIEVDDTVYFDLWVDESASDFAADTVDVHLLEFEWESGE